MTSSASSEVFPPIAEHRDHEVLFGKVEGENRGSNPMDPPVRRSDPLFWLRDDERKNPDVIAHLLKEKAYFESQTKDIQPLIRTIFDEHISHIEETSISAPYIHGPYLYYQREQKGKSYKIYCRCPKNQKPDHEGTAEEVLLDVNKLSEGKAFCDVGHVAPSPSHELVAFAVDFVGEELYSIQFIENKKDIKDTLQGTDGGFVWDKDGCSLFYVTKDEAKRSNKVWRHILGKPQAEDVCIYEDNDVLFNVGVEKSGDEKTLLISSVSSETTECHLLDLQQGLQHNETTVVLPRKTGVRYSVEMHGTETLIILTNEGGHKNNMLLRVSRDEPTTVTDVLVPHSADVFLQTHFVMHHFILVYGRYDGQSRIWIITPGKDGNFESNSASSPLREVFFDESVFSVSPVLSQMKEYMSTTFRMAFSSLNTPLTYYDADALTFHKTVVKVAQVGGGFQADNYQVERVFATAPDGTKIPIILAYLRSLDLSSPKPCLLYGYGSYGICMDPNFRTQILPYLDRGVIYALAQIRGGGEMGRDWYEVGAKYLTKRNTFTDFIACAEHLIEKRMTEPSQLACEGRSAGGLLIGAVLNMRPDLFKVAIAGVPFVDVMTTMCDPSIPLTTGEWEEWGNPNECKYYEYMLSYSPIDNVKAQAYPHIMIQAGLFDPRVAYWEPAKWVSKLRETKTDKNEILLNMDLESGHFSAKDRYRYWRESAIQQAFVCKHLRAMAKVLLK